jgi:hypothetical protein
MDGACSTHERNEYIKYLVGNLKERDNSENLGADGKII